MKCNFSEVASHDGKFRCLNQGCERISRYANAIASCPMPSHVELASIALEQPVLEPCVNRGDAISQTACVPCGGTRIKTFACSIHGECQIDDKLPSVKSCKKCNDKITSR